MHEIVREGSKKCSGWCRYMCRTNAIRWEEETLALALVAKDLYAQGYLRAIEKAQGIRYLIFTDSVVITCCNRIRDTFRRLRADKATKNMYVDGVITFNPAYVSCRDMINVIRNESSTITHIIMNWWT